MVTLQENTVQFNNKLIVSHNGGQLSSDSGLTLMDELMDAFHFTQLSEEIISFNDNRKYCKHSNSKILKQLILQLAAGYKEDTSEEILQYVPVILTFASAMPLRSNQPISPFWERLSEETLE